jgi:pimeloyl-ACP methyl ester carboxylesterase
MNSDSESTGAKRSSKHRRILHWVMIIGLSSVCGVLVLASAGAAYQWIAHNRDLRQNPRPGQLVDVGGYRMHLYCLGQGSPTVVFDSGLGDTWLAWHKVQPPIAQFTRVCSYDRAGLGWSDPSPHPRTSSVIAEELHTLLHNAGIAGPFVLVGHSLGGMNVRMFAVLFRPEVAGIVLVDSTHPDQQRRLPQELKRSNAEFLRKQGLKADSMTFGIPRLMGWCGNGPPEIREMLRTVECRLGPWREHFAEGESFDESADEVRAAGSLGKIPLAVLSHDPEKLYVATDLAKQVNQQWDEMQGELAQLSTDSSRAIAKGSGHHIQVDRPDLVIAAVRKLVEQPRNSVATVRQ